MATPNIGPAMSVAKANSATIENLSTRLTIVESKMSTMSRDITSGFASVEQSIKALAHDVAEQKAKPTFDPARIIGYIKDIAFLAGMGAAAIIYISTNISSAPLAVIDQRLAEIPRLERQMGEIASRLEGAEKVLRWRPETEVVQPRIGRR